MESAAKKPRVAASQVMDLGLISYPEARERQLQLREERIAGLVPDTLLLLEHPPTITIGRGGKAQGVVAPTKVLAARGVQVFPSERGGQATFHGPGQVVGYLIVDLQDSGTDVHRFVDTIEQLLIDTLGELGLRGRRIPGLTGVWIGERKIAAMGLHLKRWVSMHGFALNVSTDLSYFDLIIPCGITEGGVTSIERELGSSDMAPLPGITEIKAVVAEQFSKHFAN